MSSTTKSDYGKPLTNSSSTNQVIRSRFLHSPLILSLQFDSSQSPLALLAQTCSSIGKDFPSNSSPLVQKSLKRSSPSSDPSSMPPTKKSSHTTKTTLFSTPSSFTDSSYPLTNSFSLSSSSSSTTAAAALLLQSSFAYLSAQQPSPHPFSSSCSLAGCYQCESSSPFARYRCSSFPCHARFSTHEQLIEHIRLDHSSSSSSRYHPYPKVSSSQMFNPTDQLPYFYPYLSLTPMTETSRQTKKNSSNPN